MRKQRQRYLSYLLRLWQTSDGKEQIWRASLESPGAGERQGFASLKDLVNFLQAQTESRDEETRGCDTQSEGCDVATNA